VYALKQQRGHRTIAGGAAGLVALAMVAVPDSATFWARLHGAEPDVVVQSEDRTGVAVMRPRRQNTQIVLYGNGIGMGWLPYGGAHTVLGALPALMHPRPERIAIIGLGAGETLYGAAGREETMAIDSIEIVRPELAVLERFPDRGRFPALGRLLGDPRIHHHFTDGRAFLRRRAVRYDVIEADALRPTSAYSGNLYSVEYFQLVRDRLAPGGFAVTWAPTPRVLSTFISVFPHVLALHDVAVGSLTPIPFDPERIAERLRAPFTHAHYAAGRVDIEAELRRYLSTPPQTFGPDVDRAALTDLNRDLFPRDEFGHRGTEPFSTD
jgi:spermidine synthase